MTKKKNHLTDFERKLLRKLKDGSGAKDQKSAKYDKYRAGFKRRKNKGKR
tara:strand:+ start:46 stop:195 length:150 start_codon:yes stop_codon:yes gene_type:complete